jgi:hypothetical protein
MFKHNGWTRTEYTTKGPDPTAVVTWIHELGHTIVEFQGVYRLDIATAPTAVFDDFMAIELHRALEAIYDAHMAAQADEEVIRDIERHRTTMQVNDILELLGIEPVVRQAKVIEITTPRYSRADHAAADASFESRSAEVRRLGLPPLE